MKKSKLSPSLTARNLLPIAIAAVALLSTAAGRLPAQSTPLPPSCLSSFDFPQWNDGIGWKAFNAYSSIHLADIDGDGQDELVGNGPKGVEVWHWEPHGQAWVQMNVGTPTLAPTDELMTADVDGDGQSEIIQITPNFGSSPVVNVWHYDGNVNPSDSPGPGVWRLQPQLRLTLPPSVGPLTPLSPVVAFANLGGQPGPQALVTIEIRATPGLLVGPVFYTPFAYQVNPTKTGWTTVAQGPLFTSVGILAGNALLKIGDVTGDRLPDLVLLESDGLFLIFSQLTNTGSSFSFSQGAEAGPAPGGTFGSGVFALGDVLGAGYDQIYTIVNFNGGQQLNGFHYIPGMPLQTLQTQVALEPNAPANGAGLQVATTGLNPANPSGQSILLLNSDGLDEYGGAFAQQRISNTPFISQARFGDSPSHYSTIQSGTVLSSDGSAERILIARDASSVHTLIPTASTVCGATAATTPGFDFPRTTASAPGYFYFPPFTGGQALAYNCFGILNSGNDIQTSYSNRGTSLNTLYETVSKATWPPPQCSPVTFLQTDFQTVQSTLETQIQEAQNVQNYFGSTGLISYSLSDIYGQESNYLSHAIQDLQLPADANSSTGASSAGIAIQVVGSIFSFLSYTVEAEEGLTGLSTAGVAGVVSEAFSVIGDVISDVQQFESSPSQTLQEQGLSLSSQLSNTYSAQKTASDNALDKVLQNWDLLNQLNQQIESISVTSSDIDNADLAAAKTYGVWAWQQLLPSAWKIYGQPAASTSDPNYQLILGGYPSQYTVQAPISYSFGCALFPGLSAFVYLSVPTAGNYPPAPVSAIQDLTDPINGLGVNLYDVLGQRNGWGNVQIADARLFTDCYPGNIWTIPAVNPYYTPTPAPQPSSGLPYSLRISGGQPSGQSQTMCQNTPPDIFQQSTPINSVFSVPITISVQDSAHRGVSGATVQVSGEGLSPSVSTLVTDPNGNAIASLLANNIIEGPYTVTFSVTSGLDPQYPGCGAVQRYLLQNTPAVNGTTSANPDVQAVVQVTSKGTVFTTDRLWNLLITDPTGTAVGGTATGQLIRTIGSASCQPVPVFADALHPTTTPGQFTSQIGWDFSSCKGLNVFTLTVTGNFNMPLVDGSTPPTLYKASYSTSTKNQTP